ncbi:MAG: NUDIX domain-containing protein [Gammaproteobacteria bacterium]|nr:NUDIX domain-containing protein [Gammaproteobacteria bacterium]
MRDRPYFPENELPPPQWLPEDEFKAATKALPLVSLDLCIVNSHNELLLGKRVNEPAQGWWFTPGGCIRKHEPWQQALARIAKQEVGCDQGLLAEAKLMGIYDHFYPTSAYSAEVTTHYVNLPHSLHLNAEQLQLPDDDQHIAWQWLDLKQATVASDVHHYVQTYAHLLVQR